MTKVPDPHRPQLRTASDRAWAKARAATVASCGVRVRLVPIGDHGVEHEHRLVSLWAACESLRVDAERLCQQVADLLEEEGCGAGGRVQPASVTER